MELDTINYRYDFITPSKSPVLLTTLFHILYEYAPLAAYPHHSPERERFFKLNQHSSSIHSHIL